MLTESPNGQTVISTSAVEMGYTACATIGVTLSSPAFFPLRREPVTTTSFASALRFPKLRVLEVRQVRKRMVSDELSRVHLTSPAKEFRLAKALRKIECGLLILGLALVAIYVGAYAHRTILSRAALDNFRSRTQESTALAHAGLSSAQNVDFSLWSQKRIADYEQSLAQNAAPTVALLQIPKIHLEVPVLDSTDDLALNRGVGHIAGTGQPGQDGNVGIAGHRDGFFRGLKDVGIGDTIELVTPNRTISYVVDQIQLVEPSDVSVLSARTHASLTLVTCYPFYFVGSAPQRYIVQASTSDSGLAHAGTDQQEKAVARKSDSGPRYQ